MAVAGRKAIQIDKVELQEKISLLESMQPNGKFPNRSALWVALSNTTWAKSRDPRPLTGQVAYNLAKKYNITLATPVGERGIRKGQIIPGRGRKKGGNRIPLEVIDRLRETIPVTITIGNRKVAVRAKLEKTLQAFANGSRKAGDKLHCMECGGWDSNEVRHCRVTRCFLHPLRPYQNTGSETNEPIHCGNAIPVSQSESAS